MSRSSVNNHPAFCLDHVWSSCGTSKVSNLNEIIITCIGRKVEVDVGIQYCTMLEFDIKTLFNRSASSIWNDTSKGN